MQPYADRTIGRAVLHDESGSAVWRGYSMERPWVDQDGDGRRDRRKSHIVAGRYRAVPHGWGSDAAWTKFDRVWRLLDVPDASAILIHAANRPLDLEGCIGLGMVRRDIDSDGRPDIAASRDVIYLLRRVVGRRHLDVLVTDGVATDPSKAPHLPFAELVRPGQLVTPHPPVPLPPRDTAHPLDLEVA